MSKPKVYFTKEITPEKIVEMYKILNKPLPGKVGVKVHSGEKGNKNFLRPEFFKPIMEHVKGTIIECNTAYPGARNSTEKHKALMDEHEWTKYFNVDILDSEGPDITLEIPNGIAIKKNYIGKHTQNYDSALVIAHFKGHFFQNICSDKTFKETMADAAYSTVKFFKGNMAFINVMKNISLDCDCDGNAKEPCMKDIGILSSTDPVALDKASLDMIFNSKDEGKKQLIERIEQKLGPHIIECSVQLGTGKSDYELITV